MDFDEVSYIMGYEKGEAEGSTVITVRGSLVATDDGTGIITLTEVAND